MTWLATKNKECTNIRHCVIQGMIIRVGFCEAWKFEQSVNKSCGEDQFHHTAIPQWRCNRTEQLPVFFNCHTFWPRQKCFFAHQVQAQMRHFYQLWHVTYNIFSVFFNCPSFWPRLTCHFPLLCCLCPYMGDGSHIGSCQFSHFKISFVYISVVLQDKILILIHIIHYIQIITNI